MNKICFVQYIYLSFVSSVPVAYSTKAYGHCIVFIFSCRNHRILFTYPGLEREKNLNDKNEF